MRVLFVTPPPWRRVQEPSLGVGYVAAVARACGHQVFGCEMNAEALSLEDFRRRAEEIEPDVVAITSLTANVKNAFSVARASKEILPSVPVVLGGPHATFATKSVFEEESAIDVAIRGEGELTFPELLSALDDRARWPEVRGIGFRASTGIITTDPGSIVTDLDRLPFPDREVLRYDLYTRSSGYAPMITSRGCTFSCRFCDVPVMMGRRMRYRSVQNVASELENLLAMDCHTVNFRDDVFTINRARTFELARAVATYGISWGCETRVDLVDRDMLEAMHGAGLSEIRFGAESLNDAALEVVNKGITPTEIRGSVKTAVEVGIERVRVSFILGIPGESLSDLVRTIELAESLHPAECRFWPLTPLPGTPFGDDRAGHGLTALSSDWSNYNAITPVTETPSLSLDELKKALELAWSRHGHPLPGAIS